MLMSIYKRHAINYEGNKMEKAKSWVHCDFIKGVVEDTIWYANKYNMNFAEALGDWEGSGSNGSWGLSSEEKEEAFAYYKLYGYDEFGCELVTGRCGDSYDGPEDNLQYINER